MHPIFNMEVKMGANAIVMQIKKWGPTALAIAGSLAAFLLPSVQASVKAHPTDLAWAVLYAVITHLLPSPIKK